MRRRDLLTLGAGGLALACGRDHKAGGRDSPTLAEVPENETRISVRGGEGAIHISRPVVTVGGQVFDRPNEEGIIVIPGRVGSEAEVRADGHLEPRVVRLAPGFQGVSLWYLGSAVAPDDIRALVYEWDGKLYPLLRLPVGAIVHLVPEGVLAGAEYEEVFLEGIAEGNRLGGGFFSFALAGASGPPSGAIVHRVGVDPNDPWMAGNRAVTYRDHDGGGYVTGGRTLFASVSLFILARLAHELGHVAGLFHSKNFQDLMAGATEGKSFTDRELAIVAGMYGREPGNTWVDVDPSATATSSPKRLGKSAKERQLVFVHR